MKRTIIQISGDLALCNDGTLYRYVPAKLSPKAWMISMGIDKQPVQLEHSDMIIPETRKLLGFALDGTFHPILWVEFQEKKIGYFRA